MRLVRPLLTIALILAALTLAGADKGGKVYIDAKAIETLTAAAPSGAIMLWPGATAPAGWQLLRGATVSRTTYAAIWAACDPAGGGACGTGDGSTTFTLPNAEQRVILGKAPSGTGSTLGGTGGALTSGVPSATVSATILVGGAASTTHTHDATPPFLALNFIIKN